MTKDYYQILEIRREATEDEITQAYKNLSLKWHPKLSKSDKSTTYYNFCQISEAYEVLSDPHRKAFYDLHGESQLKKGLFLEGKMQGGYAFAGNPEQIFEKFFEMHNPFTQLFGVEEDNMGSMFGHSFRNQNFAPLLPSSDLSINVQCTLEELYNGCSKKVIFQRQQINPDGRTTSSKEDSILINIKPGSSSSTEIIYPERGNEFPGQKPSNLIFKICEVQHELYRRKGDNLVYIAMIRLVDALLCQPIQIVTLDQRRLFIGIDSIPGPKYLKKIKGEGMPIYTSNFVTTETLKNPQPKGDLFIQFDIKFPSELSREAKEALKIHFDS